MILVFISLCSELLHCNVSGQGRQSALGISGQSSGGSEVFAASALIFGSVTCSSCQVCLDVYLYLLQFLSLLAFG